MIFRKNDVRRAAMVFILAAALVSPLFAGGGGEAAEELKGPVTVGSKIDTEGALLGNVIVLMLQENGFDVVDRTQTGTTPIVWEAITAGEIDVYPEYTGNGFWLFSGETEEAIWRQAESAYNAVQELDNAANDIFWLTPAPANNTWAIALRSDLAQAENLATLEDLAEFVNAGGDVKLAGSEEFVSGNAGLKVFEETYGFEMAEDQLLIFSSGNTALTAQAAASGEEGVNASMAYGTDGQLAALGLVVMDDSLGSQIVYEPAPRIRGAVLEAYPEIADILEPVFLSLDLVTLQGLNARIAVNGEDPRAVAEDYLRSNGFL